MKTIRPMTKIFKLSDKERTFECSFKVPANATSFIPEILVEGKSKAVVSAFDIKFLLRESPAKPAK